MRKDTDKPRRRSLRLVHYDYSGPGAYFVTLCAQDRRCLFGEIVGEDMEINGAGRMICEWIAELENKFPVVDIIESVVMPNHTHAILCITEDAEDAGPEDVGAVLSGRPNIAERVGRPRRGAPTLGAMVGWFKTMTTNAYIRGIKECGWPRFHDKLWQRNYYEHIIRNEDELHKIREYIRWNPAQWALDSENPLMMRKQFDHESEIDIILRGDLLKE